MIFDPPILALLLAATVSTLVALAAAVFAVRVLRHWNVRSGSALQIRLERRTYLVTTALKIVMIMQMAALALFVHNADRMAILFTGAMCALGTLNVNQWGMPAFLVQIGVFFASAVWLLLNRADEMGRDYPFTRAKYAFLLLFAPLVMTSAVLQWLYFLNLDPNVITSCCSKLFTPEGSGLQADLSAMDPKLALIALFTGGGSLVVLCLSAGTRRWLHAALGILGGIYFILSIIAVISAIAPYIYETPNHHCPFCLLKPQYGFIGYLLYLPLFGATALTLATGLLATLGMPKSLQACLPTYQTRLGRIAATLYLTFTGVALYVIMRSHLILIG